MEKDTTHVEAQQNTGARTAGVEPAGSHLALAQSLKACGEAQEPDHQGWAVVSRRAEGFARQVGLSVTRLLFQPDLRLRDPARDEPLQILNCSLDDAGNVRVSTMGMVTRKVRAYLLDDLHVDGPVSEAVKTAVQEAMRLLIEDSIGKAVSEGQLSGLPSFERLHLLMEMRATTPEELVDQWWERLGIPSKQGSGAELRYITRAELADAMLSAAMFALDRRFGSPEEAAVTGDGTGEALPPMVDEEHRARVQGRYDAVAAIVDTDDAGNPLPTVHHLEPHPQYVMDRDGSCKPDTEA